MARVSPLPVRSISRAARGLSQGYTPSPVMFSWHYGDVSVPTFCCDAWHVVACGVKLGAWRPQMASPAIPPLPRPCPCSPSPCPCPCHRGRNSPRSCHEPCPGDMTLSPLMQLRKRFPCHPYIRTHTGKLGNALGEAGRVTAWPCGRPHIDTIRRCLPLLYYPRTHTRVVDPDK